MSFDATVTSLRSTERTPLLFTTNMGLEDVVIEEYRERATAKKIDVPETDDAPLGLQSYALVHAASGLDEAMAVALDMKSVHHILAPLYSFSLPEDDSEALRTIRTTVEDLDVPAMENAGSFRVTTVRRGEHNFTSIDVQREAGAALESHYGTAVDLEEFDAEIRVDVHVDRCLVSVQQTREALSRRQARLYQPRAALKPNVAYALLRLAHADTPSTILDPFCGSGTILWEAGAVWPDAHLIGNDWNEETLAGARDNAEAQDMADRVQFHTSDVWYLAEEVGEETIDLIVTNPPFGVRLASSMDFKPFYRRTLQQFHAVLRPEGRVVILVLRQAPFNQALRAANLFDVRHVRVIEIGGLYPRVFVLERQ